MTGKDQLSCTVNHVLLGGVVIPIKAHHYVALMFCKSLLSVNASCTIICVQN